MNYDSFNCLLLFQRHDYLNFKIQNNLSKLLHKIKNYLINTKLPFYSHMEALTFNFNINLSTKLRIHLFFHQIHHNKLRKCKKIFQSFLDNICLFDCIKNSKYKNSLFLKFIFQYFFFSWKLNHIKLRFKMESKIHRNDPNKISYKNKK